ncbi:MAG: PTS sugar transporter subunit IIA [Candidatus Cloacimonetes bacterium]|nr:PTS sugar transporter subunit IIA [Candidatus Cloacimonadota bacterium]
MDKDKILTLQEVAEMLKVSPETVLNLLSQKELKGIRVGNQWRFMKSDIEQWQTEQGKLNIEKIALENVVSRFFSFINSDFILMDLKAGNRFEILAQMAQFAKENGVCTKPSWLFDMLSKRERLISTGIGNGIAFLHPRKLYPEKVSFSGVLLGISRKGIDFRAMDNCPVNLFILILMKSEQQHLFVLSYLSQLFRDESLREKILNAKNKKVIIELLEIKIK